MDKFDQTNNTDKRKAKEINLRELYLVIRRRIWVIVIITALFTIVGVYLSHTSKVLLYKSSARIIIGADEESRKTLQVIIRDKIIMEKVAEELGLQRSPEALAGQITVESIDDSQVVRISVIDSDPILAAKIADTTAQIFRTEVPHIIGSDYIRILSKDKVNTLPLDEGQNNKIIMLFVFGLIAGIGLVFLMDSLDDSIRTVRDVEQIVGIPVLGRVPKINKRNVKKKNNIIELDNRGEKIGIK